MPVYRRADVVMSRGEGVYLFDNTGKRYLDCASGIAVNALGHGHPHVVAALKDQADRLWHCSNNYRNEPLERFSARLTEAAGMDSAFFCSSGGEAVEAAIKFIRRYHYAAGQDERKRIITFENGFHGRSMACISAGGNDIAREGYGPLLEGFDRVPFNDLKAVEVAITPQTAGIMLELVQGEGGVHVADKAFVAGLRALCDRHGLLLFIDDVQAGYGRSGALFTHQLYDIRPDMVTCAKGIGNGFPLGACLVTEAVAEAMTPGCHGSTYGSNPLAMAVGNAVLDVMLEPGFFAHVQKMGAKLNAMLNGVQQSFPDLIRDVRGIGLMQGVQLAIPARPFADSLRKSGLLVAPASGDVLRFLSPLVITEDHIDEMQAVFTAVLQQHVKEPA